MAQHDYNIANQTGASFRTDLNNCLSAVISTNSGSSAPSTTSAYMLWGNTSAGELQIRNAANNGWQGLFTIAGNINRELGIKTDSPTSYNSAYDDLVVVQGSGNGGVTIVTGSGSRGGIAFADGTSGAAAYAGYLNYDHATNYLEVGTGGVARMQMFNTGQVRVTCVGDTVSTLSSTAGAGTVNSIVVGRHSASEGSFTSGTVSVNIYTNGNIQNTNNSYGSLSDLKLKENIVDANSQWDDIKAVRVRNFNLKAGQTHKQIGVIAQEIEQTSPGLVFESPDVDANGASLGTTTKSVSYSVLHMKALKALQEAMERIETLEAKVAALEAA